MARNRLLVATLVLCAAFVAGQALGAKGNSLYITRKSAVRKIRASLPDVGTDGFWDKAHLQKGQPFDGGKLLWVVPRRLGRGLPPVYVQEGVIDMRLKGGAQGKARVTLDRSQLPRR
jgi:hypothetical protein